MVTRRQLLVLGRSERVIARRVAAPCPPHGTRAAFERDRRRDADLTAAGWRVLRLTWRRLTGEPAAIAAQLQHLLGA